MRWKRLRFNDDLLQRLRSNDVTLPSGLNLEKQGLGDEEATRLADALSSNTTTTGLSLDGNKNLDGNKVGHEGVEKLATMLLSNSTLQDLDLSWNKISDAGAGHLAKALESNSTLQDLYLFHNEIGDEGSGHLAKALESNSTLQTLNLGLNRIGNQGAQQIANVLSTNSNKSIRILSLASNEIEDEGGEAIMNMIQSNKSIQELYLRGNKFSDDMKDNLKQTIITKNNTIFDIDLFHTDEDLQRKLQHNFQSNLTLNSNNKTQGCIDSPYASPDRLGYSDLAKGIVQVERQVASPTSSFCVGIYAPWGAGKTKLIELIKEELDATYKENRNQQKRKNNDVSEENRNQQKKKNNDVSEVSETTSTRIECCCNSFMYMLLSPIFLIMTILLFPYIIWSKRNEIKKCCTSTTKRIKACAGDSFTPIKKFLDHVDEHYLNTVVPSIIYGKKLKSILFFIFSCILCPIILLFFLLLLIFKKAEKKAEKKTNDPTKFIFVDFNAWTYNGSDNLWAAFMAELWDSTEEIYGKDEVRKHRAIISLGEAEYQSNLANHAGKEVNKDAAQRRKELYELGEVKYHRYLIMKMIRSFFGFSLGVTIVGLVLAIELNDEEKTIMKAPLTIATIASLATSLAGFILSAGKTADVYFKYIYPQLQKSPASQLLEKVNQSEKKFERHDFTAELGFMGEVKKEMRYLMDFAVSKNARFQITIDDLDRCTPKTVTGVLENCVMFLMDGPVTCWLAIDTRILSACIHDKNRGVFDEAEINGEEYLQKLIQLAICIQDLITDKKKVFINRIFVQDQLDVIKLYDQMLLLQENKYLPIQLQATLDRRYLFVEAEEAVLVEEKEAVLVEKLRVFLQELISISKILRNVMDNFPRDTKVQSIVEKEFTEDWDNIDSESREAFLVLVAECIQAVQLLFNPKNQNLNSSVESDGDDENTDILETLEKGESKSSNVLKISDIGRSEPTIETDDNDSIPNTHMVDAHFITMVKPIEKKWFNDFSPFITGKARKIICIMNSYNLIRYMANSALGSDEDQVFFRKLLKFVILVEQWPYRMAWLLQIAEDFGQKIGKNGTIIERREKNEKMKKGEKMQGECITEILQQIYREVTTDDTTPTAKDIFAELSLLDVYQGVTHSLMYSSRDFRKELSRDGDPELFEKLLADYDDELKDELRLTDLALPDHYSVTESLSLRPFMYNMQWHMLEKVARDMDAIILHYDRKGQVTKFERKEEVYHVHAFGNMKDNEGLSLDDKDDYGNSLYSKEAHGNASTTSRSTNERENKMPKIQREWRTAVDFKSGRTYYYDKGTKKTQWKKPNEWKGT